MADSDHKLFHSRVIPLRDWYLIAFLEVIDAKIVCTSAGLHSDSNLGSVGGYQPVTVFTFPNTTYEGAMAVVADFASGSVGPAMQAVALLVRP